MSKTVAKKVKLTEQQQQALTSKAIAKSQNQQNCNQKLRLTKK